VSVSLEQFEKHLGQHLLALALFVLPKRVDEDGEYVSEEEITDDEESLPRDKLPTEFGDTIEGESPSPLNIEENGRYKLFFGAADVYRSQPAKLGMELAQDHQSRNEPDELSSLDRGLPGSKNESAAPDGDNYVSRQVEHADVGGSDFVRSPDDMLRNQGEFRILNVFSIL
jgi:hypothetical protein